jgi:hypothetical protein
VPTDLSKTRPLRVGIMTGRDAVPRWVARLLDRVDACPFAGLTGFVLSAESPRDPHGLARLWGAPSDLLYRAYTLVDRRRFGTPLDPLDEIDISERLSRLPVLTLDANSLTALKDWELDVLLALGYGGVPAGVLDCARFGVWSFHHDCSDSSLGGPALFWEIYHGAQVSPSVLLRRSEDSARGEPIYCSYAAPDPVSLHRARTRIYWKSAEFVVRKLRDIHRDGNLTVVEHADRPTPSTAPLRDIPSNRQMLRFGCRLAVRVARQKARRAFGHQQWFIAYRRRGHELPTADAFRSATVLVPPRDRFYADPCLVDWRGSSYLFFEELIFADHRGVISCCQLTPDGRWTTPEVVLERPYHLSYPFVFFVGEQAFMLPETAANGAIELYKARSFPRGWALEAVLVSEVRAVDPTTIERDGRHWLFANVAVEGASTNDELFLFSARSVRGPWEPHPRNPIVSDVRHARPAGRPFIDASGGLIRPSQDCSGFYGSAVVFNRIEELGETDYRETPVARLEPSWQRHNLGTHTYTRSERWEAVDGRSWMRRESRRRRSSE